MENMYLLVEDNCNADNDIDAHVGYVYFGTEDEVRDEMNRLYEWQAESGSWDNGSLGLTGYSASVWDDNDSYDCHLSWWMVNCGPKPKRGGLDLIVKGYALNGGGIEVTICGRCGVGEDVEREMLRLYGEELAHPSFYAGWDPEYCEICPDYAIATVETMDEVVKFDVIPVIRWDGSVIHEIDRSFEYVG